MSKDSTGGSWHQIINLLYYLILMVDLEEVNEVSEASLPSQKDIFSKLNILVIHQVLCFVKLFFWA